MTAIDCSFNTLMRFHLHKVIFRNLKMGWLYCMSVPIAWRFKAFKIYFIISEDRCFFLCKFDVDPCTIGGDPLDQKSVDRQTDRQIDGEMAFQLYKVYI